jgi:hypothetical protein
MERVTILLAVILSFTFLGIGEEVMQPVAFHAISLSPEAQSHTKILLEAVPAKLHRHEYDKYGTNIARARSETESRNVYCWGRWASPLVSFTRLQNPLTLQQQADDHSSWRRIESVDVYGEWYCRPWWEWVPSRKKKEDNVPKFGIDVQALGVLNQSPGGQRPFFSRDLSTNSVARNWDFCTKDTQPGQTASLAVLHEPTLGVTASIHFRDPVDMANAPEQTRGLTIHPMLTAQVDLLNYTFKKDKCPWLAFKATIAPQLDLYGRSTGKEAQFQWPLQPNIEWHLNESYSAVFQVSIPHAKDDVLKTPNQQ